MTLVPQSEAALAEVVAGAAAPLALRGGGTRGGVVAGQGLSAAGLGGIRLYEPGALVMVAGAGTPLAEAEAAAAAEGQRLAFEPPDLRAILGRAGTSTLGGVFAANASGPRRVQAGAARDALLGIRLVTGRGEVVANGGRVMKNVTGYDLVKLSAGSRGGLGVLTEVAFRLQARPEAEVTLQAKVPDRAAGLALMAQALATPFEPSGAALSGGRVFLRLEGLAGSVRYRQAALAAALRVDLAVAEGRRAARCGRGCATWRRWLRCPGRCGGWCCGPRGRPRSSRRLRVWRGRRWRPWPIGAAGRSGCGCRGLATSARPLAPMATRGWSWPSPGWTISPPPRRKTPRSRG